MVQGISIGEIPVCLEHMACFQLNLAAYVVSSSFYYLLPLYKCIFVGTLWHVVVVLL